MGGVLRDFVVLLYFEIDQPCLNLCPLIICICFPLNDQITVHNFAKGKIKSEKPPFFFRSQILVVLCASSLEA